MKNSKVIKKILVATGIITSLTAIASAIGAKTIMDETKKKRDKIQGKTTYSSLYLGGKNQMIVKEDMDILFPSTILGTNEVDFTQNPLKKVIFVDYVAVLGTIVLRVPKDVKVICEEYDTQVWKSTVEVQSENIDENDATTVYVKGSEIGGCLKVVRT